MRPTGFYFLYIAYHLAQRLALGRQCYHRGAVGNQGNSPVLQLSGGVGLAVNVADLLEL